MSNSKLNSQRRSTQATTTSSQALSPELLCKCLGGYNRVEAKGVTRQQRCQRVMVTPKQRVHCGRVRRRTHGLQKELLSSVERVSIHGRRRPLLARSSLQQRHQRHAGVMIPRTQLLC
jgi:hypothetical protein